MDYIWIEFDMVNKKAQHEGRAFLSYIGKPEEEENLPNEFIYDAFQSLEYYFRN